MLHTYQYVYSANIAALSCNRNAAEAEAEVEGAAAAEGRAGRRPCGRQVELWPSQVELWPSLTALYDRALLKEIKLLP